MNKLKLMVCPHDTAKDPERWYLFAQYLGRKLGIPVQFDLSIDFKEFQDGMASADIVFANPGDVVTLMQTADYACIARPEDIYDEVVFIAQEGAIGLSLNSLQGKPVATVTSMLPTYIALSILKRESIEPGELVNKGSWLSVINSVKKSEVEFGFLYKDTYAALTNLARSTFQAFSISDEKAAFHSIMISPGLADKRALLEKILLSMDADEKGCHMLNTIGFSKWCPATNGQVVQMKAIVGMN